MYAFSLRFFTCAVGADTVVVGSSMISSCLVRGSGGSSGSILSSSLMNGG